MGETYITETAVQYLPWSAGAYAKKGWEFCVGSARDCDHFVQLGAIRVPWGARLDRRHYQQVRSLILKPIQKALRDALPTFVRDLPSLEHLSMPSTMIVGLESQDIPPTVTGLTIWNVEGGELVVKEKDLRWPSGTRLPNVKALRLLDEAGSVPSRSLLGLSPKNLPSLEYIECLVNKSIGRLEAIAEFHQLQFVWLEFVKHYDVFGFISSPVKALSIVSADSKFTFGRITGIKTLELVRLNALKCEIDCQLFTKLPRLMEVSVYNSRRIVNPEALLACKRLKSIEFIACGGPFDEGLKQRLEDKGYERLEVDFA